MERSVQQCINRMARSTLGVIRSTPVPFLIENAGSMPAGPRLMARQRAFVVRTIASESAEIRMVSEGRGPLAAKVRGLAQELGIGGSGKAGGVLERVRVARGLFFPGKIQCPVRGATDTPWDERHQRAVEEARKWEKDPCTLRTNGSAFPTGIAAAAVVGYMEPGPEGAKPERVSISSTGGLQSRIRSGRRRQRNYTNYNMMSRSSQIRWSRGLPIRVMQSGSLVDGLRCHGPGLS